MVKYDPNNPDTAIPRTGMRQPAYTFPTQPTAPAAAPTPSYAAPTAPSMSNYFSDPLLQQYLNATRGAMAALSRPTTVQNVPTSNPAMESAIGALSRLLNAGSPGFDYLRPITEARAAELHKPGYTTSQLDQIRTQATDPLTAQRDAARQSVIQRFASQGFTPDSGIVQQALLDLDKTFAQQTTSQDTQLALNAAAQDEARRQEAYQNAVTTAGFAGQGQQTQLSAAGSLAGIGQSQNQAAFQNANMDLQRQQLDTSRILQSMGLSQNLAQLPIQLQAQQIGALNALQGPVPQYQDPSLSALMSLLGIGQGQQNQQNQNTSAMWASLIAAMPGLINAVYHK